MQELRAELWDWMITILVAALATIVVTVCLIIIYSVLYSLVDFIAHSIKEKSLFNWKNRRR